MVTAVLRAAVTAATLVAAVAPLGGCTGKTGERRPTGSAPTHPPPATATWTNPSGSGQPPGSGESGVAPAPPTPAGGGPAGSPGSGQRATLAGWTATVYYTAVERFHGGPATEVLGCPGIDCAHGSTRLGRYPRSFVDAVRAEGTGHTASGVYLNWSEDTGYWLDQAPRDTAGRPLRPFESAAADRDVLAAGTRFTIATCGRDEGGDLVAAQVCDRLRSARWTVTDEFTPGLGGQRHVDVYIGEETGTNFTDGPWYVTLVGATLYTG